MMSGWDGRLSGRKEIYLRGANIVMKMWLNEPDFWIRTFYDCWVDWSERRWRRKTTGGMWVWYTRAIPCWFVSRLDCTMRAQGCARAGNLLQGHRGNPVPDICRSQKTQHRVRPGNGRRKKVNQWHRLPFHFAIHHLQYQWVSSRFGEDGTSFVRPRAHR